METNNQRGNRITIAYFEFEKQIKDIISILKLQDDINSVWELYNIWRFLPKYWSKLRELQARTARPFKKDLSIFELEKKFENGYIPKKINKRS